MDIHGQRDVTASRGLYALLLLMGGSVLGACVLAPPLFNGLLYLGRSIPVLDGWREVSFEALIARLVLVLLVLGFVPALRWARIRSLADIGLPRQSGRSGLILRGWALGIGTAGVILVIAWMVQAYTWAPVRWSRLIPRMLGYLAGGLLIGLIEEIFFRGGLFGLLRKQLPWALAAVLISIFFSAVHFLRPMHVEGVVHGHWYSGFSILPYAFYTLGERSAYFPYAFNLFLIGFVLCILYQRQGHLFFIIGLHAGWVVVLQAGRLLFEVNPDVDNWLFSLSGNLGRTWGATLMLLAMCVWAWTRPSTRAD